MGCISSKKGVEDSYPNIFQVMNVDEHGNHINEGQIEITDVDLVLYQQGKSPIKWPLRTLRRYGFDTEHFSFESGRRCQTGPGIYAFRCSRSEELFNLLQCRIQTRNSGENETTDVTSIFSSSAPSRDSLYLEPASVRRSNVGSNRLLPQNGEATRLSSVGSASGSLGPLSPQSFMSTPSTLDIVSVIPLLPTIDPLNQISYANEEVVIAVTQNLEETNNNKSFDAPVSPFLEHSYLNSTVLDILPKEDFNDPVNENPSTPEESSNTVLDKSHFYMNVIARTDEVDPCVLNVQPEPSADVVTLEFEKPEDSLLNAGNSLTNSETDLTSNEISQDVIATPPVTKSINYIVLDLEPSGDSSQFTSLSPDIPWKPTSGYAAIDFKKTAALLTSINPNFETDNESSRKTRHSSNINNLVSHEKYSSSVSE